jgi:trehalose 6-phosphate phosphatase
VNASIERVCRSPNRLSQPNTRSRVRISVDGYDAVLFDMDGVVTRTSAAHAAAWKEALDRALERLVARSETNLEPFDPESDYQRHLSGHSRYAGIERFLAARGIRVHRGSAGDPPGRLTVHGIGSLKNERYLKRIRRHGVDLYPEAIPFIRAIRDLGLKTALVSSSRNCLQIVREVGIEQLFDTVVDGNAPDQIGVRSKPAPDMFLEAAARLGVSPERAVVVEDAVAGVNAGRAGGFGLVVGVARPDGPDPEQLRRGGAHIVVRRLDELLVDFPGRG